MGLMSVGFCPRNLRAIIQLLGFNVCPALNISVAFVPGR